jgi:primosomal protein N' (replication factor Y)
VRLVDALAAFRSARFDRALTYDAASLELRVGDVVRVPLGKREVVAYVVRAPYDGVAPAGVRAVAERLDAPRAFDETGLALAQFIADAYVCTLGEALTAVVRAEALPRAVDSLVRTVPEPHPARYPSVPKRLLDLVWDEFDEQFALARLLRHPEARRSADRAALLRHVQALVRSGDLRRERRIADPRSRPYTVAMLAPGPNEPKGRKAEALYALVSQRGELARAEALLAGFSGAVIARATRTGALVERRASPRRDVLTPATLPEPHPQQAAALAQIERALGAKKFGQFLLHGVTGSGKTLVYLRAIVSVVREGGRAIVLVPEIALTPQAAARFEAVFGGRVAVLHSGLSDGERLDAWQACTRGEVDVVVGARSAVFAPLENVRLLVVDESHESSYKQESVPRYQAVAVARERMRLAEGVLLLGSATPSLESYAAARSGRIALLEMHERVGGGTLPSVEVVDLSKEFAAGRRGVFSAALTQALAQRLERGEKSVLFVNRRGSARVLLCRSCGAVPQCPRCSVALAVHRSEDLLRCHYCDYRAPVPARCAACGGETLAEYGPGTERVAQEIARLFPGAVVLRMDSDTTTRVGDHARILREFEERGDVLVGTQMVAKGLDFPTVTLAAAVSADVGLHVPDFRAGERTFALIMQVCGRSGRAAPGDAIVQTYSPEHPAVVCAAAHDYEGFAQRELLERKELGYPPYSRLSYLAILGASRERAIAAARKYAGALRRAAVAEVLGPAPFPIARVNREWRFRVALRTHKPAAMRRALREVQTLAARDRETRLAINVDP